MWIRVQLLTLALIAAAWITVVPTLAQSDCSCGQTNCVSWVLNCSNCGLAYCGDGAEKTTTTDQLDGCRTSIRLTCAVSRDGNGQTIVCGSDNQITQCLQRTIQTSGYPCSGGDVLKSYSATSCCK
jgi:hypothetical protein